MRAFFSKLSQSLQLPIALLPAAGIMLGIGASFTSETFINQYGLERFLGDGTLLGSFLIVMTAAGQVVFTVLPILFAIGIAIGFAKKEKGSAALAAFISYMVMIAVISTVFTYISPGDTLFGDRTFSLGETEIFLGFENVLSMGVFGGIIAGAFTVIIHNKYIDTEVPAILGFFGGARLIPILASFSALVYGLLLCLIWPPLGAALSGLGNTLVSIGETNYGFIASFLYGVIQRALIPFGLHHLINLPIWQTAVGGTYTFDGVTYYGTMNAYFGLLASGDIAGNIDKFPSTNFLSGPFPVMMFGLPGAAYAMYAVADEENKKDAGGLLLSAGLTSFLTGITEPIEFTFLFISPFLFYGFHIWMSGLSFAIMDLLGVKVGMTFSNGFIDFFLYGVLPGPETHWYWIPVVGVFYFIAYFFFFKWYILKKDIATPGRSGSGIKLVSKEEVRGEKILDNETVYDKEVTHTSDSHEIEIAAKIVEALGGEDNLDSVEACITRLRVTVKDELKVKPTEYFINHLEAIGVSRSGKSIQVIYGAKAAKYKSIISQDILQNEE